MGDEYQNSVLSGKESSNFVEKVKEMEIQRCLEAEKKRLLSEVEVGTIFKANAEKMDEEDKSSTQVSEFHNLSQKNGNRLKIMYARQQMEAMRFENIVDQRNLWRDVYTDLCGDVDTALALIDAVPAYSNGNNHHPKWPETALADGKQAKQIARKRTGSATKMDEVDESSTQVSGFHNLNLKNGNELKIMYTRKQMEAMRFENIVDQRNMWRDIYTGLAPELATEYDRLACSKNQKNPLTNCDRRQPNMKKDRASSILGENSAKEILDSKNNVTGEDYAVEEDYVEDDDSENDYDSILKPAFAVQGEPNFDSGPPEDGLEYLRRVRWEAKQIPNVKVAKMDRTKYIETEQSVYMPQIPEIAKCPEHLLPVKEWEETFLCDFSNIRMALSQLDGESLPEFISEEKTVSTQLEEDLQESFFDPDTDEIQANQECSANPKPRAATCGSVGEYPTVSAIQKMDSVTRVAMLRKRICLVETMRSLERRDCAWIFALCAAVDTPLNADTCASLRGLLRKCASIRAAKSEVDDEVVMANILATISGRYFGQMES